MVSLSSKEPTATAIAKALRLAALVMQRLSATLQTISTLQKSVSATAHRPFKKPTPAAGATRLHSMPFSFGEKMFLITTKMLTFSIFP